MKNESAINASRHSLFGTDGIRGRANEFPITPEAALLVGKAIALLCGASGPGSRKAIIGKDTRLSGYMLETALTSGLVSMGMDVLLVGPMPTPAVAHLTRSMAADVGIMLTASHNPFDDNGIKIFGSDGFKISDEMEATISAHVQTGDLSSAHIRSDQIGKVYRLDDAPGRYIEHVKSSVDSCRFHGLTLALDCANGAAYAIAPLIFRELGARVIRASSEPDGYNINNNCGALHPQAVAALVRRHGADVGVALDGDADRIVFCDAEGRTVDGDRIIAMCALDLHSRGRLARKTCVVTTMSNLGLHQALQQAGITVETTDVGDRLVIERLRAIGGNLGGEKSGHVIFLDYATTGDGILTALQVLRLMKEQGATLAELAQCLREYPQRLVNVPAPRRIPLEQMPHLQAALGECHAILGTSGRTVIRYSGTENMLRILVEARDEAAVQEWSEKLAEAARNDLSP